MSSSDLTLSSMYEWIGYTLPPNRIVLSMSPRSSMIFLPAGVRYRWTKCGIATRPIPGLPILNSGSWPGCNLWSLARCIFFAVYLTIYLARFGVSSPALVKPSSHRRVR